ncbi:MAG: metallo-mystery pair system four-Cys motif protein [Gemmatimonadales bacterium]
MKPASTRSTRILLGTLAAVGLAAACSDGPTEPQDITVNLKFAAEVNGAAFACGTQYTNVGSANTAVTLTDFRLYVHDVRLLTSNGTEVPVVLAQDTWQRNDLALLDFENGTASCANGTAATNTAIRGTAPAGDYTGIRFRLGVPFAMNHQDQTQAQAPLDIGALFWSWNGGYKFARIDHISDAQPNGWNVHLGSTGCQPTGNPTTPATACNNAHRPEITLSNFDIATDVVSADYGRLVAGSNLTVNATGTASGCMSFPGDGDCPAVMNRFGLSYEGSNSTGQTFFAKQ